MIPFEIAELSDIRVKDLQIIIVVSHLNLNKLKESFKPVNSIHFLLFHTALLRAILNQEKNVGRSLTAEQTFSHSPRTQGPCWKY